MRRSPAFSSSWSACDVTTEAALELLRDGDPAGALALLGLVLSHDDVDPARLAALGMVQLANRRAAEALTALRMAVALGDTSPATLLNLALALGWAPAPTG